MALTVDDVRAVVETDLDDDALQRAIDANVEAVGRSAGKAATQTESHRALGAPVISLRRRHTDVTEIVERRGRYSESVTLDPTDFRVFGDYEIVRLPSGANPATTWGDEVEVTYVPEVDAALRDEVTLKLVEVDVEEGAYDTEKVGDWSGSADWKKKRKALLARVREGRSSLL